MNYLLYCVSGCVYASVVCVLTWWYGLLFFMECYSIDVPISVFSRSFSSQTRIIRISTIPIWYAPHSWPELLCAWASFHLRFTKTIMVYRNSVGLKSCTGDRVLVGRLLIIFVVALPDIINMCVLVMYIDVWAHAALHRPIVNFSPIKFSEKMLIQDFHGFPCVFQKSRLFLFFVFF